MALKGRGQTGEGKLENGCVRSHGLQELQQGRGHNGKKKKINEAKALTMG